jgi:hypothetical protein
MKFTYAGHEYRIRWQHVDLDDETTTTFCNIERKERNVYNAFATGASTCAPTDQFCKNFGRKLSLSRAMSHDSGFRHIFNKGFRRYVWEEYRRQLGHY